MPGRQRAGFFSVRDMGRVGFRHPLRPGPRWLSLRVELSPKHNNTQRCSRLCKSEALRSAGMGERAIIYLIECDAKPNRVETDRPQHPPSRSRGRASACR
jgi:hypothetical protein